MKKKSNELIELSEKDFSFVCPVQTDDMTAINGGYFCDSCEKKVHDVSSMTKDEYRQLLSKSENICVTFKKVVTVSLALSLAACSTENNAKTIDFSINKSTSNESNNSLKPYNAVDKNQTQIVELGGKVLPKEHTIDDLGTDKINKEN